MVTNRITVDIDGGFFVFVHSVLRFLFIFHRFPEFRKTSKGYHLWLYLDKPISDRKMYLYRRLLFDDENRVRLDMRCKFKPKQVLFDEKKVISIDDVKLIKHQVLK